VTGAAASLAAWRLMAVRGTPWFILALLWFGDAWSHRAVFFEWDPDEAARRMFPSNDFQVYPVVADYLKTHSAPSATFAVLGSEPELFFYAHRRSVTGYIYMYDLVQQQPFRQRMEKEMISEVEQGRPDFVVFVNLLYSWIPFPPENFQAIQKWLMKYTDSEYDPYAVVTFPPNQYCFRPDCLDLVPPSQRFITIFQRKPQRPIPILPKSAP
jgi:hypothetical protein